MYEEEEKIRPTCFATYRYIYMSTLLFKLSAYGIAEEVRV